MAKRAKQEEAPIEEDNEIDKEPIPETEGSESGEEADKGPEPEEVIEKLKADMATQAEELKAYKERQTTLEKERGEAVQKSVTAEEQAAVAHEQALNRNIEFVQGSLTTIERDLQDALDAGDSKRIVELNRKLAVESVKLEKIEGQKEQFEVWKVQQKNKPKEAPQDQATKQWIAEHPRFNTDKEYQAEAIGAHTVAVNMGHVPGTPAYFRYINDRLERAFRDDDGEPVERTQTPQKQRPLTAAPPSRESGTAAGIKGKGRELSARQLEAAEASGLTPGEYKKYLEQCEREGLLK